jgi:hypothetical protein
MALSAAVRPLVELISLRSFLAPSVTCLMGRRFASEGLPGDRGTPAGQEADEELPAVDTKYR